MMSKTAHLDEDPPATEAYEGLAGTLAGNVDATPTLRRKIEKGGKKYKFDQKIKKGRRKYKIDQNSNST